MGLIKEGSSSVPQPDKPPVSFDSVTFKAIAETTGQYNQQDPKSRRILVQGIVQAAVQSPVLQMFCINPEEYHHQVIKLAEVMIKFVEEHS